MIKVLNLPAVDIAIGNIMVAIRKKCHTCKLVFAHICCVLLYISLNRLCDAFAVADFVILAPTYSAE